MDEKKKVTDKKSQLTLPQLIDLFEHFDDIHAGKENLFIPIVLAIIPAILVSWNVVSTSIIGIAGGASIILYYYHILVTRRFSVIQKNIFEKVRKLTDDIDDIVEYPKHIRITILRKLLMIALLLIWIFLYFIKYYELQKLAL